MVNIRLYAPLILGFILSFFCKIEKIEGKQLKQRPPSYVFGIIWPILYIVLGYSWSKSLKKDVDILHGVCTFLLSLWIVIYSCLKMKKIGIYIIASTISTVIAIISLHNHRLSKILLIPLLAWLIVAFQLNWNIVN